MRFFVVNWLRHLVSIPPKTLKRHSQDAELGQMDNTRHAILCNGLGSDPGCEEAFYMLSASTGVC